MAKRYRPVERDQPFLLPPDMRDWLPADHPVHLVIRVVEQHLDTSAFHALRRAGGAGTAGYDPDMLLLVLVWAYAHQVTSSRRMEQLCGTDVAFRLICGGNRPDHATLARFRAAFPAAIGGFFAQVLALCAALGMGRLGVVALDGTKIAASAGTSANRTEDKLRKMAEETVARHARNDAAEDVLFGDAAGDEVPPDAWSPRDRDARIAAALASLEAERQAAEAQRDKAGQEYLAAAASGHPGAGSRPAAADVAAAQLLLEQVTAAQQAKVDARAKANAEAIASTGKGMPGRDPVPASEHSWVKRAAAGLERAIEREAAAAAAAERRARDRKGPGPVRNVTDPDSRLMPVRSGGFIQGYNAQLVTSEDGLIIATRLTGTTGDTTWLEPMMTDAEDAAAIITAARPSPSHDRDEGSGRDGDDNEAGSSTSGGDGEDGGPGDAAGYTGKIGLFLADAGYCSEDNLTTPGPDRLIATGKLRDLEKAARGDPAGGSHRGQATRAMAARLQTADGIDAYRHRGHIAETPNGDIKHNKGFRQFSMRGLPKASSEWEFITATVNLLKAISSGHLTHNALDTLAGQAGWPPSPAATPA
jgi:transposase